MRLIVMGTGPFAVPAFRAVLASGHSVRALVTRPVASAGRRKTSANPMQDEAHLAQIETLTPDNVNDEPFVGWLRSQQADLFLVCDYGQILSAECLSAARLGGINLHGSLLPRYRGAAPVHWAILNGDPSTGVSVIHMTPRLDAGPVLVKTETLIGTEENTEELEHRLSLLGAEAVMQAISMLEHWNGSDSLGEVQDPAQATRAPRLRKQDGQLQWSKPAAQLHNQIRALTPWPGTYTHLAGPRGQAIRLIVHSAAVEHGLDDALPGTVIVADGTQLVIACGQDSLSLQIVQPAGKKRMPVAEFLRGYSITVGTVFQS